MRKAAFFFSGIALVVVTACQSNTPAPAPEAPLYRPASTIRDVMQSVVATSAQGLWDSVGLISNAKGTFELAPKTDEDWAALRRHAITLVESANLLLVPGRDVAHAGATTNKVDDADPGAELPPAEIQKRIEANWPAWTSMALALHDSATTILAEVNKKDVAGLERTGSDLDPVCERCHLTFWYPPTAPPVK